MKNWLLRQAGFSRESIKAIPELEKGKRDKLSALLANYAEQMLQSNVVLRPHDYGLLNEVERIAMGLAGKRFQVKQALRVAYASQGRIETAQVLSEIDDGELLERVQIEDHVRGVHELKKVVRNAS